MDSNLEKWRFFMKDCPSPDSFIDMGFYYMIGAALQRRVWVGNLEHRALFPNPYFIMVGKAGLGKGLVLKAVMPILKHHKLRPHHLTQVTPSTKPVTKEEIELVKQAYNMLAPVMQQNEAGKFKAKIDDEPLVIPVGADCTTFQALVKENAQSIRRINFLENGSLKVYTHCSLAFCLEEISSLFHEHARDVINYLIVAFDCGDYEYKTKTQGNDIVKKTCLSFFGGTTPEFMEDTFDSKLMNQGFASRTTYIFENAKRFERWGDYKELSEEQLLAREDIVKWIGQLTELYGEVKYTPEAYAFFKNYFEKELPINRVNKSRKLDSYYERANIHTEKLAIMVHYARSLDNLLTLTDCKDAIAIREGLEVKMHMALTFSGRNPLGAVGNKIAQFITKFQQEGIAAYDIWTNFVDDVNETELEECLKYLQIVGKVRYHDGKYYPLTKEK